MPAVVSQLDRSFERRLSGLVNAGEPRALQGGKKGVEKESLRVTPSGELAQSAHPESLGSALTNENITTDYSEALIELVTPPFAHSGELQQYLLDLHQFVYQRLGEELLWATSMPGDIQQEEEIPVARYGSSHVGRMKSVYRQGLGLRYGRMMQAISGVHFNYSFPLPLWELYADLRQSRGNAQDFISASYFELLRAYRRHGWLVLYLFGVSPLLGASFLKGRDDLGGLGLLPCRHDTLYGPYATSLRMSDAGYRNRNQSGVAVSVNSLQDYVRDLSRAISTANPAYEALGVEVDGQWRQLNANLLQIENEYYSFIRPKRVARSGERPTKALLRAGVEYVEVRALDVSAFDPAGVNPNKLRFLEAFLALCLLKDSPPIGDEEQRALDANHVTVARRGREPGLTLWRDGRQVKLTQWAAGLLDEMTGICELLDHGDPARPYSQALALQAAKIEDVALTPSARLLADLEATGESFFEMALRMSAAHKAFFLDLYPSNTAQLASLSAQAEESLEKQRQIEAADRGSFEEYLARYFA